VDDGGGVVNLAIYHPLWFAGLCGICILNAYIVWRIDHPRRCEHMGQLIQVPQQREEM
jgi:hypothetical protein